MRNKLRGKFDSTDTKFTAWGMHGGKFSLERDTLGSEEFFSLLSTSMVCLTTEQVEMLRAWVSGRTNTEPPIAGRTRRYTPSQVALTPQVKAWVPHEEVVKLEDRLESLQKKFVQAQELLVRFSQYSQEWSAEVVNLRVQIAELREGK